MFKRQQMAHVIGYKLRNGPSNIYVILLRLTITLQAVIHAFPVFLSVFLTVTDYWYVVISSYNICLVIAIWIGNTLLSIQTFFKLLCILYIACKHRICTKNQEISKEMEQIENAKQTSVIFNVPTTDPLRCSSFLISFSVNVLIPFPWCFWNIKLTESEYPPSDDSHDSTSDVLAMLTSSDDSGRFPRFV